MSLSDLPIDDKMLIRGLLVTDRTDPGGLLLIHLDVKRGVEALQMGARQRPARDHQPHLSQLHRERTNGWRTHRGNTQHGLRVNYTLECHKHAKTTRQRRTLLKKSYADNGMLSNKCVGKTRLLYIYIFLTQD